MTEEEMVGWHHQLNGHEFWWTSGVGDGQGGLVCWVRFMGLQRVGQDWVTELSWTMLILVHYYYLDVLLLTSLSWQCKEIYVNYSVTAIYEYQKWTIIEFMLMMGVRLFNVGSNLHISKCWRLEWSMLNGLFNINKIYIISCSVLSNSLQPHRL